MQDYSSQAQGEPIDKRFKQPDNSSQDGHSEIIDRRQLVPLNDTTCKHEEYIEDPSDETDDFIAMVCSNPKCPVGYLKAK